MAERPDASRLAHVNELLIGAVENGPWVLIPDPQLRQLVGGYIAENCHTVALAAGLDEAMERAHDVMPERLARSLPGERVAPDARERLGRYLWAADGRHPAAWDHIRDAIDTLAVSNAADGINLKVAEAPVRDMFLRRADAILTLITEGR